MRVEKMTYYEARWWILNDWESIEKRGSEYYKKPVLLLYCKETKNIFFADKKTRKPIYTILYSERNKKPKDYNQADSLKRLRTAMNKQYESRKNTNK